MKIICFIDSLNSGGAQRQICTLAILLKKNGFDVEILVYHDFNFFSKILIENNININLIDCENKYKRILEIKHFLKECRPDIVISFLRSPNLIVEILSISGNDYGLIVSERSLGFEGSMITGLSRYIFHLAANAVVTNSYSQGKFLGAMAPWLKTRLHTIINCVDIERFCPSNFFADYQTNKAYLVVVGRFEAEKQPFSLLSALEIIERKNKNYDIRIDWFGNNFSINGIPTKKSAIYLKLKEEIEIKSLKKSFILHEPTQEISEVYHNCSALILPSIYEGCSNVICEAMACGKPVLASRVGDNVFLVEDGVNGFLFDPKSPEDMADKMMKFAALSYEEKQKMGESGREKAVELLSPERFCDEYIQLIQSLIKKKTA